VLGAELGVEGLIKARLESVGLWGWAEYLPVLGTGALVRR